MKASYLYMIVITLLIINGGLGYGFYILATQGALVATKKFVNPTLALFFFYQSVSFLFLTMVTTTIAKEKLSGNVNNLLAYGIPFPTLVVTKSLFVTLLSLSEYPVLLVIIGVYLAITGKPYLLGDSIWVDGSLILFVFPLLVFIASYITVFVSFFNAHLSQLCSLVVFVVVLVSFQMLKFFVGFLSQMTLVQSFLIFVVCLIVICGLFLLSKRVPLEAVLKP